MLLRLGGVICVVMVLAAVTFFTWQRFFPVQMYHGWRYQVLFSSLDKPSGLVMDENGNTLVAEELNHRQGRLVSLSPNGQRTVLFSQLDKPDGLLKLDQGFVFAQEAGQYPVIWVNNGQSRPLFAGINVQGLTRSGNLLYAVEDRDDGRLFRYNLHNHKLDIKRGNLDNASSLAICPDDSKFYNEKEKGVIRHLSEDGSDPVYLSGLNKPAFLACDQDGLWITEDSTHRARLLLYTPQRQLLTIASFLRAPQHLFRVDEHTLLLAEQGRGRVLKLTKN